MAFVATALHSLHRRSPSRVNSRANRIVVERTVRARRGTIHQSNRAPLAPHRPPAAGLPAARRRPRANGNAGTSQTVSEPQGAREPRTQALNRAGGLNQPADAHHPRPRRRFSPTRSIPDSRRRRYPRTTPSGSHAGPSRAEPASRSPASSRQPCDRCNDCTPSWRSHSQPGP